MKTTRYYPTHCNRPMDPYDQLFAWVDTHEGVEVDDEDSDFLAYDPTGFTDVIWGSQVTVGYGCRSCGKVVYLESFEDLGKDYTVNDMIALLLREAAMLLSEDGENPEYDRAISELICSMTGQSMDSREIVEANLREINRRMKEAAS